MVIEVECYKQLARSDWHGGVEIDGIAITIEGETSLLAGR